SDVCSSDLRGIARFASVLTGTTTHVSFENPREVRGIAKSKPFRDRFDFHVGVAEQMFCDLNAHFVEKLSEGDAEVSPEEICKMATRDADGRRDVRERRRLGVVA